jgi:hypothetical protein
MQGGALQAVPGQQGASRPRRLGRVGAQGAPRLALLGTMPGASCGSFHSISHMGPLSGGSRLRSTRRTSSRLAPQATGGPPCTCSKQGGGLRKGVRGVGGWGGVGVQGGAGEALRVAAMNATEHRRQPGHARHAPASHCFAAQPPAPHHQHFAVDDVAQGQPAEGLAEHLRHLSRILGLHLTHKACRCQCGYVVGRMRGCVSGWGAPAHGQARAAWAWA